MQEYEGIVDLGRHQREDARGLLGARGGTSPAGYFVAAPCFAEERTRTVLMQATDRCDRIPGKAHDRQLAHPPRKRMQALEADARQAFTEQGQMKPEAGWLWDGGRASPYGHALLDAHVFLS